MPSSISFLPAPAPAAAPSIPASDLPSGDPGKSFDSVLNKAAPASGKSGEPRTSVTGSARASTEAGKSSKNEKTEKSAKESKSEDTSSDASLLTAEELAAMLALMGTPVAAPPPPPPVVPVDITLTGDVRASDAADVGVEGGAGSSSSPFLEGQGNSLLGTDEKSAQEAGTEPVFALTANSENDALSPRDLLQQGAEVIEYQLQPSSDSAAVASSESVAADQAAAATTAADNALAQAAAAAQQSPESTAQSVDSVGRRFTAQRNTSKTGSEKIAALGDSQGSPAASGVKSSIYQDKNNFLNVADKELTSEPAPVGTDAANWGDSMNQDARSTPFVARLIDGALSLLGTSSAGAATMDRSVETPATPAASAAQAAQIVSEIRDIADGLWAVERNSVEVRFNYSPTERLSVKVEYRDGVVQTTFRTDSPELRDTIAREWQTQVASASESRPYRVADPVFNTPPADARGFSLGGDASRQQRQAEQSGSASHTFATTSGRGPSSSSVAPASVTVSSRPDTALHLHAFA